MNKTIVRSFILPLHEKMCNRRTFAYLKELESIQWLTKSDLKKYQFDMLKRLLAHALKNVEYYKGILEKCCRKLMDPIYRVY